MNREKIGTIRIFSNAVVLDIGVGGAALKTTGGLNEGKAYSLRLNAKGRKLWLPARAVWSRVALEQTGETRGEFAPIYSAGLKFEEATRENVNAIASFMMESGRKQNPGKGASPSTERRSNPRIKTAALAMMDFSEECRIENIGLGGIRIRNFHVFEPESIALFDIRLNEQDSLKFQGRVTACSFAGDKDASKCMHTCIEFLQISNDSIEKIRELIRSLSRSSL